MYMYMYIYMYMYMYITLLSPTILFIIEVAISLFNKLFIKKTDF
jgi:hypothetical protein